MRLRRTTGLLWLALVLSAYFSVLVSQALASSADLSDVTRLAPTVDLSLTVDAVETAPVPSLADGINAEPHGVISAVPVTKSVCGAAHRDVPWQPDVHLGRHLRPASRSADDTPG